jgi:hypothetical protein
MIRLLLLVSGVGGLLHVHERIASRAAASHAHQPLRAQLLLLLLMLMHVLCKIVQALEIAACMTESQASLQRDVHTSHYVLNCCCCCC